MTSQTTEDYLRVIERLSSEGGEATVNGVAQYLDLAKSSVSEKLKSLAREGLVKESRYAAITLTSKGKELARAITSKHRIIEVFLHETLGMAQEHVHEQAHLLEHAFTDETMKLLAKFLGYPKTDPHGKPIEYGSLK